MLFAYFMLAFDLDYSWTLKMNAICFFRTLVAFQRTTGLCIPEDSIRFFLLLSCFSHSLITRCPCTAGSILDSHDLGRG
jgi:hypothetical protein